MMTFDLFFTGAGTTALGVLLGAWLSCRLTYGFQQRLLQLQLDFQKRQAEADAALRKQIHDETLVTFTEFRTMINARAAQLVSRLSPAAPPHPPVTH